MLHNIYEERDDTDIEQESRELSDEDYVRLYAYVEELISKGVTDADDIIKKIGYRFHSDFDMVRVYNWLISLGEDFIPKRCKKEAIDNLYIIKSEYDSSPDPESPFHGRISIRHLGWPSIAAKLEHKIGFAGNGSNGYLVLAFDDTDKAEEFRERWQEIDTRKHHGEPYIWQVAECPSTWQGEALVRYVNTKCGECLDFVGAPNRMDKSVVYGKKVAFDNDELDAEDNDNEEAE